MVKVSVVLRISLDMLEQGLDLVVVSTFDLRMIIEASHVQVVQKWFADGLHLVFVFLRQCHLSLILGTQQVNDVYILVLVDQLLEMATHCWFGCLWSS